MAARQDTVFSLIWSMCQTKMIGMLSSKQCHLEIVTPFAIERWNWWMSDRISSDRVFLITEMSFLHVEYNVIAIKACYHVSVQLYITKGQQCRSSCFQKLKSTILYYIILYYIYHTILYYTKLQTILGMIYTPEYNSIPYTILYYTILYYIILYLQSFILYCTMVYYSLLYYTIL